PSSTQYHLQRAEQLRIHTFILNSGAAPGERAEVGRPREKYKYWIGQVTPDDLQASYFLADMLIDKAGSAGKADDGKVHVIGLGGWGGKNESEEYRYNGLRNRIHEHNDAQLVEFILTGWSKDTAYNELLVKLEKHPKISAIWSASDTMALGAVKAAEKLGIVPEKDIFIGGFDWSLDGINAVIDGK